MRYFLTFLIGVGLVVLLIILLIRAIFGGGAPVEEKPELVSYAYTNTVMRLTISGPIVADAEHREIRIDISQYSNDVRTITGYEGRVDYSNTTVSNPNAYASFLRGLDLLGYTRGSDKEETADERGYCPFGRRYVFEIIDGADTIQRYWATSCGDTINFKGDYGQIVRLFQAQIPEYNEKTRETRLN